MSIQSRLKWRMRVLSDAIDWFEDEISSEEVNKFEKCIEPIGQLVTDLLWICVYLLNDVEILWVFIKLTLEN